MPPVTDAAIVPRPVTWEDASHATPAPCGAESVFLGRTRAETHPELGALMALAYDAYAPMAEAVLRSICADAASRHACAYVGVHHATGPVPIGEASVVVRALAPHRDAAFRACREVIDRLKVEAPIWKREVWERASVWREDAPLTAPAGAAP